MPNSDIVFTTFDPLGNKIILRSVTRDHIIEKHGVDSIDVPKIRETIEEPDIIKESTTAIDSYIYISETENSCDFNVPTKINKELQEGYVRTAYKTRKPISGKKIWTK